MFAELETIEEVDWSALLIEGMRILNPVSPQLSRVTASSMQLPPPPLPPTQPPPPPLSLPEPAAAAAPAAPQASTLKRVRSGRAKKDSLLQSSSPAKGTRGKRVRKAAAPPAPTGPSQALSTGGAEGVGGAAAAAAPAAPLLLLQTAHAPSAAAAAPCAAQCPDLRQIMTLAPLLDIKEIILEFYDQHVAQSILGLTSTDTFLRRALIRTVLRKHLAQEISATGFRICEITEIYEYALCCFKKLGITQFAPLTPEYASLPPITIAQPPPCAP